MSLIMHITTLSYPDALKRLRICTSTIMTENSNVHTFMGKNKMMIIIAFKLVEILDHAVNVE